MFKPEHFRACELVDPVTFQKFGETSFQLFNPLALAAADELREHFNVPVTINNWWKGGPFRWRGLRTMDCSTGAKWSQHRLGGAFDCDIKGVSAEEARQEIIKQKGFGLITCLEAEVNWVHFDVRNIDVSGGLLIVNP